MLCVFFFFFVCVWVHENVRNNASISSFGSGFR
ncbi:hypothetical protein FWK35_00018059 [Aphis craccivora]|uniref:Uncharacterized protein n=1 Tax=Aphis craccivora TaxID=307492 RepID=A0A6G0YAR0_APHCR|nr:hypothetical protein FWK35_00018059 [Aphis craccivora]